MDTFLRSWQREELRDERSSLERSLKKDGIQDKGSVRKALARIDKQLEHGTPPELTPAQKDACAKELGDLDEKISSTIPSGSVMRRNPPGAVDMNVNFNKRFGKSIQRRKNLLLMLNPDSDDRDMCSIEKLRPWARAGDPDFQGAQIEGKTFIGLYPTEGYKQGWDRIWGDNEEAVQGTEDPEPERVGLGLSVPEGPSSGRTGMENVTSIDGPGLEPLNTE